MGGTKPRMVALVSVLGGVGIVAAAIGAGPAAAATSNCASGYCIAITAGDMQTVATGTAYAALEVQITQGSNLFHDGQVTYAIGTVNTAHASFGGASLSTGTSDTAGDATPSAALTPTTQGEVLVNATFTGADTNAPPSVTFTLYACGPSVDAGSANGAVATTPCSTTTTTVAPEKPPYACIGAGCGAQTAPTTPVVTVSPVVQPESAPTPAATGAVRGAASLANTGADAEPLTAAGVALIGVGLMALGASALRRRPTGD